MKTRTKLSFTASILIVSLAALPAAASVSFPTEIFRAAAVGAAVSASAPALNKFINTVTFQGGLPSGMSTKVVPILSVGEKGYVGAAQVAGPSAAVSSTKVVWAYDDNFSRNEFRIRILVPGSSLNPLQLQRVQKVGVTAVIDYAVGGRYQGQTWSKSIGAGEVIKAAAVAAAINAAAEPINKAVNVVTRAAAGTTKVVPIISFGEKAYVGGVQVTGSAASVSKAKSAFQYEATFDSGRYRIKAFVASDSINPLKFKRLNGLGISAIIDTSIADQESVRRRSTYWRTTRADYRPMDQILAGTFKPEYERYRHDRGLHKGWYIGKGNQRKQLTGVWVNRYQQLPPADKEAFVEWWDRNHQEKPDVLEKRWMEWRAERERREFRDREEYRGKPGPPERAKPGKGKGRK